MPAKPAVHVALLRGINVGGKNKLPMRALVAMFEAAGARRVRTYIQSGNVVFEHDAPEVVAKAVERRIEKELALRVPLVLRSARELARVIRANPAAGDTETLHVMFLADTPAKQAAAGLDAQRSPPDTFTLRGRDIYLRCPSGLARTKLTNAYFDGKLSTTSTCRNWRTVLALLALAEKP